jgi:MazG family protein
MPSPTDLGRLLDLVARLRSPAGCPWDREQRLADVRSYLLEEAHEAAAAIDAGDWQGLAGELGDLLFQVAFVGRLAEEEGAFALADSIARVHDKMVARHPHVFGGEELATAQAVREAWERRKASEPGAVPLLSGVAPSLPALTAAYRMTQKAAGVGFDWPAVSDVLHKLDEEVAELKASLAEGGGGPASSQAPLVPSTAVAPAAADREAVAEEIGDLLFTVVNLARKLGVDPEGALARTNLKFRRRFERVERGVRARGKRLGEASLAEMDALWEEAKAEERAG